MKRLRVKRETPPLKLDFVYGLHPREGFGGVACRDFGQLHGSRQHPPVAAGERVPVRLPWQVVA